MSHKNVYARLRPYVHLPLRIAPLAFLAAGIGLAYQARENYIPYWDLARSYRLYHDLAVAYHGGLANGLSWLHNAINTGEHNPLFSLPYVLAGSPFGYSRHALLISMLILYLSLYLAVYGDLVKVVRGYPSLNDVGFMELFGGFLLPVLFISTLLGFEDIAGLPFLVLAYSFYIRAAHVPSSAWRRIALFILAGFAIGATYVVRRTFAYSITSFYAATFIVLVYELISGQMKLSERNAYVRLIGPILSVAATSSILFILLPENMARALEVPYAELYKAWATEPHKILLTLVSTYGGAVFLCAGSGYALFFLSVSVDRPSKTRALYFPVILAVGLAQWIFMLKYPFREHHAIQFVPAVAIGISLLLSCEKQRFGRGAVAAAAVLLLFLNIGVNLGAVRAGVLAGTLFARSQPPTVREDIPELHRLVDKLRDLTSSNDLPGDIWVLGSTNIMNASLLSEAEIRFYERDGARLRLMMPPAIDRRDNYPVYLVNAQWLVVGIPLLHKRPLDEQRTLLFAYDEIMEGGPVGMDFARVDGVFNLRDSVDRQSVAIFRRVRPTGLASAIDYTERSLDFVVNPPVYDDMWVCLDSRRGFRSERLKAAGEKYALTIYPEASGRQSTGCYLLKPVGGAVNISGEVRLLNPDSSDVKMILSLLDYDEAKAGVEKPINSYPITVSGSQPARFDISETLTGRFLLKVKVEPLEASKSGKFAATTLSIALSNE